MTLTLTLTLTLNLTLTPTLTLTLARCERAALPRTPRLPRCSRASRAAWRPCTRRQTLTLTLNPNLNPYPNPNPNPNPVDPKHNEGFWTTWHDFEVAHGNEDTFREMLRVKRSVKAHFSQAAPAP